jgi:hypothetical protein
MGEISLESVLKYFLVVDRLSLPTSGDAKGAFQNA